MKNVRIVRSCFLFCLLFCPFYSSADGKLITNLKKNFRNEIYSESSLYQKYDVVTESRVRTLYPIHEDKYLKFESYFGIGMQHQSAGAAEKFFDNTVTPFIGIQTRLWNVVNLQVQGGVRTIVGQQNSSEWDPRIIASLGHYLSWNPRTSSNLFTDLYAESVLVSRIDSTPVSVAWLKQGYRFEFAPRFYLDPYAEFFIRQSRNSDLGPAQTDVRSGVRAAWHANAWTVAALVFKSVKEQNSAMEGLFVLGGNF